MARRAQQKTTEAAQERPPGPDDESGPPVPASLEEVAARHPHVAAHLETLAEQGLPRPQWTPEVTRELKGQHPYNFLYPVGDPIFIHVREPDEGGLFPRYHALMPQLDEAVRPQYEAVRGFLFDAVPEGDVPEATEGFRTRLDQLLDELKGGRRIDVAGEKRPQRIDGPLLERFRFLLFRDLIEHGVVEPVMKDPWIEDIHSLGLKNLHVVHKVFGMVDTDIRFAHHRHLDGWLEAMGERMGRPVSGSSPIVDGALPDGSRINILYSDEISKGGSSWTVRKFSDTPIPVTQIVAWGTLGARTAAYLWLCLEHGMSVFVAGETASGKTTTTNSILPFIPVKSKIMTAEDTPEVLPPHKNWQQLITRDRGTSESSVTMYDLLKAGLRSRPNYIIVGEIRGAEGAVAFQAMQTGHPTMATFHASSVGKLIQRFTSDPINVPAEFMPNLNVVLIQMAVYVHGKMLRRVLAVEEIEGYSKRAKAAVTRQVFNWDSVRDEHLFGGRNNSYVLENLVAPKMGLEDPRAIYEELERRTWILEEMIRREMFDYHEVQRIMFDYGERGEAALPFAVPEGAKGGR
ncbi:MAG: type II/IV secretion system ATPase subunit [Thermoplasmatota archaeon]